MIGTLAYVAIDMGLRKVFKIDKRDKTRPRFVNKFHKWGEISLIIVFIISYFIVMLQYPEEKWVTFWILYYFLVLSLFRTFIVWKYPVQQREYITYLFGVFVLISFVLVAIYTDWLGQIFGF